PGIGNRAYRAERIATGGIARDATTALEPLIPAQRCPTVARMSINTVGVALPNFHARPHHGLRRGVENAAVYGGDLTERPRRLTLDDHEVGIDIAAPLHRIEGSFRLARRRNQLVLCTARGP